MRINNTHRILDKNKIQKETEIAKKILQHNILININTWNYKTIII